MRKKIKPKVFHFSVFYNDGNRIALISCNSIMNAITQGICN